MLRSGADGKRQAGGGPKQRQANGAGGHGYDAKGDSQRQQHLTRRCQSQRMDEGLRQGVPQNPLRRRQCGQKRQHRPDGENFREGGEQHEHKQ